MSDRKASFLRRRRLKERLSFSPLLIRYLSQVKNAYYSIVGVFRYYFLPRRQIVFVLSSMRAGSTLFKSLIGEAEDVSLLDEFNFLTYEPKDKYLFYGLVCSLADEKIILLKKPYNNNRDKLGNYGRAIYPDTKKIVLYRDPYATLCSLKALQQKRYNRSFTENEGLAYWCDTYEGILRNTRDDDVQFVSYEELTTKPVAITAAIFSFIGSSHKEGVSNYSPYGWVAGRDDISDNLKTLTVRKHTMYSPDDDPELYQLLENTPRVATILAELRARH